MPSVICCSVGFGVFESRAVATKIWPDWHQPHCTTSSSLHAACTALPALVSSPSMVVICLPSRLAAGVTHARVGLPSTSTVHAPHAATPQPNLVPVSFRASREYQSSGMSAAPSYSTCLPLMLSFIATLLRDTPVFALNLAEKT